MKTFIKLFFSFVIVSTLSSGQAFASSNPSFETLSAAVMSSTSVQLRGDFNSNDNNYFPTDQPYVWFEYGTDPNDFSKKTIEVGKVKGNYIVSHSVYGLKEDRTYYYRAAIRFDSETEYGKTLSFVSVKDVEGVTNDTSNNSTTESSDPIDTNTTSGFLTPEEQYQQYIDATTRKKTDTDSENESNPGSSFIKTGGSFSFLEFFGFKKKEEEYNIESNSVISDEEIALEEARRQEMIDTQEKHNNSAAYDDELGEVIEYNTQYQNNYKRNTQNAVQYKTQNTGFLNYPVLLLIIILLIIVVFLVHLTLKKRKKIMYHRQNTQGVARGGSNQSSGKYHIPVERSTREMRQDPNRAFFRNPPQK